MDNILKSSALSTSVATQEKKSIISESTWASLESMRFGLVPGILTIVTCLSAIAGAYAITDSVFLLMVVGFPTAVFISTIIAVAPMRIIFALAILTTLIDLYVFFFH